ncbi:MAG: TIGR04283 family arsenosugar biosynthesis glycosyltransferase [Pseudomonadota bacterium]
MSASPSPSARAPGAPLSIVVPTLQAAKALGPCLGAIGEGLMAGLVAELIIADGGSDDGIERVVEDLGATLIQAPRGRGTQLAAGCAAARAPWLLIVHADTVLPADWPDAVMAHLRQHPGSAGYFGLAFDDPGWQARMVGGWANLRSRLFALPYGDQALLVPRTLYEAAGGYPEIPLMEDVSLVRAIVATGGRGALRRLPGTVVTSAERYRRDGWWRRGALNLSLLLRWRLGADPATLAERYRRGRS